jgi:hypothetical protein
VAVRSAWSYDVPVPEDEQTEYRILTGEWVSTREFADRLREQLAKAPTITPAEEDEVEFVSPRVAGRMRRGLPGEGD